MESNLSKTQPYLLLMGVAVAACSQKADFTLLEKVQNKSAIDQSIKEWSLQGADAYQKSQVLHRLLGCAQDPAANLETRAYCLQALNSLSGKSDQALEEINGLILPVHIAKLAKVFEKIENTRTGSR